MVMLEQCANKVLYEYTVDSRLLFEPPRSAVKLSSVDWSAVRKRLRTPALHDFFFGGLKKKKKFTGGRGISWRK